MTKDPNNQSMYKMSFYGDPYLYYGLYQLDTLNIYCELCVHLITTQIFLHNGAFETHKNKIGTQKRMYVISQRLAYNSPKLGQTIGTSLDKSRLNRIMQSSSIYRPRGGCWAPLALGQEVTFGFPYGQLLTFGCCCSCSKVRDWVFPKSRLQPQGWIPFLGTGIRIETMVGTSSLLGSQLLMLVPTLIMTPCPDSFQGFLVPSWLTREPCSHWDSLGTSHLYTKLAFHYYACTLLLLLSLARRWFSLFSTSSGKL